MNRTMLSILKVLDTSHDTVVGSREISRRLVEHGIGLSERTVRYHLRILDEKGLTKVYGKEGRRITQKGRDEISQALVSEKVGFVINRIETLSFLSDFDVEGKRGRIILNVTFFPEDTFRQALSAMEDIFASDYAMSDRVAVGYPGDLIGDVRVPEGAVCFGTVCSVTINSILLKAGIPVTSKFGGILKIDEGEPIRFTSLISYGGSSLDPLEIFIKSGMTDVKGAVKNGSGKILASFREIPLVCVEKARDLKERMRGEGIGGIVAIGNPNQDLLEMPVGTDKAGLVVVGGLNPVAAAEEAGVPATSRAMSTLYEYADLKSFAELKRGL